MNSLTFYERLFSVIYIHSSLKSNPLVKKVLERLPSVPVCHIDDKNEIPAEHLNARTLFMSVPRASILNRCPGSKGHICCNYLTIDLYEGCTLGCTYCIMKSYLNFAPVTVHFDGGESIQRVCRLAADNPEKTIRVGTGEVGDSDRKSVV